MGVDNKQLRITLSAEMTVARVNMQGSKILGESLMLLGIQTLVAKNEHLVAGESGFYIF